MRICSAIIPLLLVSLRPAIPADIAVRRPVLDVNAADFPASSLVDFSFLLDPPAGKHGFLEVGPDGDFRFEDGAPGRFWGINVAKDSVFQPTEVIDGAVEAIAEAGFNLVRLHHLDDVGGLLPPEPRSDGQRIAPDALAKVDYWIARLKERGIYVYLDLLDYRTFQPWEGVPNGPALGRGAKPYAVFDEKLIALQKEYAKALLVDHVNPDTGLSYARDPAVCMIELCDENGLFKRRRDLPKLREPYGASLRRLWNEWLAAQHKTTDGLRAAWIADGGKAVLQSWERVEQGTVRLPRFNSGVSGGTWLYGAARQSDFNRFAYDVHRRYFGEMTDFLREQGVRVPISAVTDAKHPADLRATADALDFVGTNFYWDHPYFKANSKWRLPAYYFNANPVAEAGVNGFARSVTACKAFGKPLVVREWGYCWPNKHRAVGMIEAATYGRLQDLGALVLFTYDTRPDHGKLGYFDVRRDPTRWGLAGLAGYLFLSDSVPITAPSIGIGHSRTDTFFEAEDSERHTPSNGHRNVYDLGWTTRVANVFFDEPWEGTPGVDLMVASGRTSGAYLGDHAVIVADSRVRDLAGRIGKPSYARSGYDAPVMRGASDRFTFEGAIFGGPEADGGAGPTPRTVRLGSGAGFSLEWVRARGMDPLGVDASGRRCWAFYDPARDNTVLNRPSTEMLLRACLDRLAAGGRIPTGHAMRDAGVYSAAGGRIVRDERAGLLVVDAPTFRAIGGRLADCSPASASDLQLSTSSPIGALVAASLDGLRLSESKRYVVKMVTIAVNTGERKRRHGSDRGRTIYALDDAGRAPVSTAAKPCEEPTVVTLGGRTLVEVWMSNGTWELVRDGDAFHFWCDLPGAQFHVGSLPKAVALTSYPAAGGPDEAEGMQPVAYPAGAAFVELHAR